MEVKLLLSLEIPVPNHPINLEAPNTTKHSFEVRQLTRHQGENSQGDLKGVRAGKGSRGTRSRQGDKGCSGEQSLLVTEQRKTSSESPSPSLLAAREVWSCQRNISLGH